MTHQNQKKFCGTDNKWQSLFIGLLLIVATLFVYWKVTTYEFVSFDDDMYVTKNEHVQQGISLDNIIWTFGTSASRDRGYWHPLTWMSHMLDWQLFNKNAGMDHLENLLIHIITALLLFFALKQMTGALWKSAFVAALFALHPLNVDSVAWIAERKNVLSTLFWMLTMLAYVYYAKQPSVYRYIYIFIAMVFGLMAKPMLVTLPCVLLLMDFWPLDRFGFIKEPLPHTLNFSKQPPTRLVLEKIPLLFVSFIAIGLSVLSLHNNNLIVPHKIAPIALRLENSLVSYINYIIKIFWPHNMAVYYPFPDFLPLWQVLGAAAIITGLSVIFIRLMKKAPYLLIGWLWFLGTLFPVIGIVQGGRWPAMADRWAYVPEIGLFIMISWGMGTIVKNRYRLRMIATAIAAAILFSFIMIGNKQVTYWKNDLTLFGHAVSISPNDFLMQYNLGLALMKKGRINEAIPHYYASLKSNPKNDRGYNNLANALAKSNRPEEAISNYLRALKINPNYFEANVNLADMLTKKGLLDEAAGHYLKAISIEPDNALAHKQFGQNLLKQKKFSEAETQLKEAVMLLPEDPELYNLIGAVMFGRNDINGAIAYFRKAISINPDYNFAKQNLHSALLKQKQSQSPQKTATGAETPKSLFERGISQMNQEKYDQAIVQFQKALSIDPKFISAIYDLAIVYSIKGEYDRSISSFKKLISIQPDNAAAYYNIACLYGRQNQKETAIDWLKKAVEHGYDNWEHLKVDDDLKTINQTEYFRKLIEQN